MTIYTKNLEENNENIFKYIYLQFYETEGSQYNSFGFIT